MWYFYLTKEQEWFLASWNCTLEIFIARECQQQRTVCPKHGNAYGIRWWTGKRTEVAGHETTSKAPVIAILNVYKQVFWYLNFANHRTKGYFVSTANKPLVGTLMTIGDVTMSIAIWSRVPETTLPRATLGELTFHCVAENVKQLFIWMSPSCLGGRDNWAPPRGGGGYMFPWSLNLFGIYPLFPINKTPCSQKCF